MKLHVAVCFVRHPQNPAAGCSLLPELREASGGIMIDLSHLTEEEQGAIMTVLRRDVELKKAEEDRIR